MIPRYGLIYLWDIFVVSQECSVISFFYDLVYIFLFYVLAYLASWPWHWELDTGKNVIFGRKIWSFLVPKKIYPFCPFKQNWFTSCHCSNVYFTTSDVLPHLLLGFISQCLTCLCESLFTEDRQVRYRSYEISVKVQIWKSWSQSERKENKRKKIGSKLWQREDSWFSTNWIKSVLL